ncbi:MAG TPA: outer membrane beta-barrel protein [Longimicrobium sp.]|jgi:opacity protein-like surface antigen|nr:outer membrane beta-barrel protein [Longimicrobium sp.]
MRHWIPALALGGALLSAVPAAAQLAAEVRLDAGIPVEETGEIYEAGVGFGLRGSLDIAPTFAVYGGYSQFNLEVDDDLLPDGELEISGWELGGRVGVGHGGGSANPYVLLGALFYNEDTGVEAGVGADYGVSWNVAVTPEVRYRKVGNLTYLTLGMGARFRF